MAEGGAADVAMQPPAKFVLKTHEALGLAVVMLGLFCDCALLTVIVPITPSMLSAHNVSDPAIGVLFASKPVVQLLVNPAASHATVSAGAQPVLVTGMVGLAASTAAYTLFRSYWPMVAARAVQGVGSACVMTGGMTLVADLFPANVRGRAMGIAMSGLALGLMAGPPLGGVLYKRVNEHAPFMFIAALLVLLAAAQLALYSATARSKARLGRARQWSSSSRSSRAGAGGAALLADAQPLCASEDPEPAVAQAAPAPPSSLRAAAQDWSVLTLCVAVIVANGAVAMLEPALPKRLSRPPFSMDEERTGLVWLSASGAYLLATPLAGRLSDSMAKWAIMMSGLLLLAAGLLALPWVRTVWQLVLNLLVMGAAVGLVDAPSMPALAAVADAKGWRDYSGLYAMADMAASLSFVVGPLLGSLVNGTWGFLPSCAVFACAAALIAPLLLALRRLLGVRQRRESVALSRFSADSE